MKALILPAAALGLLMTSGCVLSIGGDGHDDNHYTSVRAQERNNRDYISTIAMGTPSSAVVTHLGTPDFTDVFTGKDGEYRILRYRTHRAESDGDTSRDETTPLVFLDGRLVGVGEEAVLRLR